MNNPIQHPSNSRRSSPPLRLLLTLYFLSSLVQGFQDQIIRTQSQTTFDAVTYDQIPSFYTFSGFQSIMAPLKDDNLGPLDEYTISLWMKMSEEGFSNGAEGQTFEKQTVLHVSDTVECYYQSLTQFMCESLSNETQPAITVDLGEWDPRSWLYMTLSGKKDFNETYLSLQNYYDGYTNYLDYGLIQYEQEYWPMDTTQNVTINETDGTEMVNDFVVYIGNDKDMKNGFSGSLREFYFIKTFMGTNASQYMKNLDKSWDMEQLGYYKLSKGSLNDYFYGMKATLVGYNVTGFDQPVANFLGLVDETAAELIYATGPNFDMESPFPFADTQGTASFVVSPNDGIVQLPYINNTENQNNLVWSSKDFTKLDDQVFYYAQYRYEYLFSTWLWLDEGVAYTDNEKDGRDDYWFFKMDEAFTIYFTSSNTIKIYFVTFSNYVDQVSEEIFLPTKQWINLQFTIKQYSGYEVMVFDEYGQLQIHINDDSYLYDMRPTGFFYMFKNFKGYVKDIVLFQGDEFDKELNITLPYTSPLSGTELIYNDLLFVYYDFQQANFDFSNTVFNSLTYNSFIGLGQPINFNGNSFTFDYLNFNNQLNFSSLPDFDTNSTTDFSLLFINDSSIYYDGLSSTVDQHEVLQMGGSEDSGIYQAFTFDQDVEEISTISVEFWFRRVVNTDATALLFSIEQYDANNPETQLNTYLQMLKSTASDYELICIPVQVFGNSGGFGTLQYTETLFDSSNFNFDWQHVSCQYQAGSMVQGVYYSDTLSDEEYLRQRVYKQSISDSEAQTISNVNSTFMFQLGKNTGDQTKFKELRLFTTPRTVYDVQRDRFMQLNYMDYKGNIPIYNRLVALTNKIYKYDNPVLYQDDFFELSTFSYPSDPDNLVCPQYTTKALDPDSGNQICLSNPFKQQFIHLIAQEEIQVTNGIEQTVFRYYLTNQYSDMYNNKIGVQGIDFMTNRWFAVNNSGFDSDIIAVSQDEAENSYMISFKDQGTQIYNDVEIPIRLESAGDQYYTFMDYVNQTIIPQDCRWLGGVDSPYSAFQDLVYSINDVGVAGIDLIFQEHERSQTFLTCEDITPYYVLDKSRIQVNVTPSEPFAATNLTEVVQLKALSVNDDGKDVINMVVPKAQQSYFPIDEWVNIVITMQWEKDSENAFYADYPDLNPYLSVAFRIKFQQDFTSEIVIDSGSDVIQKDEDLVLSSSVSQDWGYDSDVLISKWACPNFLQTVCETKDLNADTLTITYEEFNGQSLKVFGEDYTFDLYTWMESDFDDSAKIKASTTVQWAEDPAPEFDIVVPLNQGQVLSTKLNEFKINLVNYRTSDSDLIYEWQFINDASGLQESHNNVIFSIDQSIAETGENYFETLKSYTVQVTISLSSDSSLTTTKSISFTTGAPPSGGSTLVSPQSGQALSTLFTMSINSWSPNDEANSPVTFKLFGQQSDSNDLVPLSSVTYNQGDSVQMQLSSITEIIFEISDSSLEVVEKTVSISISDAETLDSNQINSLVSSGSDTESQYSTYETIAEEINYQYGQGDTENSQSNKVVLLDYMEQDLDIFSEFSEEEQQSIVSDQSAILSLITTETGDINDDIMESTLDILSTFRDDENVSGAYQTALEDENTFNDIFQTMSNLQLSNQEKLIEIQPDYVSTTANDETLQQVGQTIWNSVQSAHRIHHDDDTNGRRLNVVYNNVGYDTEDVGDMTELKQELAILKELTLDDYCQAITNQNIEYKFDSELYQLTVEKIDLSTTYLAKQYFYDHDLTSFIFPLEGLALIEAQSGATDLCIRVNFWKENPLEGIASTRFSQISAVAAQITTYDDLGNHMLRKTPLDYPDNFDQSNEYTEMIFPMQFSVLNGTRFFANQSMCHYHKPVEYLNPNDQGEFEEDWQMSKCNTTYFYNNDTILCQCQGLNDYYFAIVNDNERIWSEENAVISVDLDVQFDDIVWVIIIINCFVLYFMQFVGCILDGRDISKLEVMDTYGITNQFLQLYTDKYNTINRKEKKDFQEMSYHESIYRSKRLAEYKTVETITCGQAYNILVGQTHPFFEIFYRYDFFLKRIYRVMIVELQLCVITLIILNIYNSDYRSDATYDELVRDELDDIDLENIRQYGFLLALLTLPLPMWLTRPLYMKIIVDQAMKNRKKQMSIEAAKRQGNGHADRGIGKKSAPTPGGPNGIDMEDMDVDSDVLIVVDKMLAFKLILFILTNLVITPLTISTLVDKTSEYTTVQTQCIVYTYIFAVVVGWFIYNPLKCALQAYVTSFKVFNKEAAGMCTNIFAIFFCTSFSYELFTDIDIVDQVYRDLQKLKKEEEDEQDHMLLNLNANFDYKKDKEQIKKKLMENPADLSANSGGHVVGEVVRQENSHQYHQSHQLNSRHKYDDDELEGYDNDLQKQVEDDQEIDQDQARNSKRHKKSKKHKKSHKEQDEYGDEGDQQYADYDKQIQNDLEEDQDEENQRKKSSKKDKKHKKKSKKSKHQVEDEEDEY